MSLIKVLSLLTISLTALVGSQSVDPNSIPIGTRNTWCTNQKASCPLICLQTTTGAPLDNDCVPETLSYTCVCSDGTTPNASEYSQTIPYFECTAYADQCAANCGNNAGCVTGCRTNTPCGAQNPTRINVTTTTSATTSSATGTDTAVATGFGSATTTDESAATAAYTGFAGAPAQTSEGAAANLRPGNWVFGSAERCGLAIVLASFFVGFAVVL